MNKFIKNHDYKIKEKDDNDIFCEIINVLQEIINFTRENITKKEEKNNLIYFEGDDNLSIKILKKNGKKFLN